MAQFTAAPKVSHAKAIKSIVRYFLARNTNKGLIVKPNGTFDLKCWVDADFAGLFRQEPDKSPRPVKSRYRCIITFGGVPLVWKSQLISEICLSTLHAEYVGLTNALRALIPIWNLVLDTLKQLDLPMLNLPRIVCKLFKDNQGAYHHFFWQHVYHPDHNPDGWLVIGKCDTEVMNADYLTKGLVRENFKGNRFQTQGW